MISEPSRRAARGAAELDHLLVPGVGWASKKKTRAFGSRRKFGSPAETAEPVAPEEKNRIGSIHFGATLQEKKKR